MDTPYGPIGVPAKNRQFAMPKEVAALLGLEDGGRVYFLINEEDPRWARVVPEALVAEWLTRGESE